MNRGKKILASVALILSTYLFLIYVITPYRVRPDEWNFIVDIATGLEKGHISSKYINGRLYPVAGVIILTILGLPLDALNWLSPLIASFVLATIISISLLIFRQIGADWWSLIIFSPSVLVFPNLLSRLRESSHKALTTLLIIIGLWLLIRTVTEEQDRRFQILFIGVTSVLTLLNYAWGTLVTVGFLFAIVFSKYIFVPVRPEHLKYPPTQIFMLPLGISYLSIFFIPGVRITPRAFLELILSGIAFVAVLSEGSIPESIFTGAGSGQVAGTSLIGGQTAGSVISSWPILQLGSISISVWFLYSMGVFLSAVFTFLSIAILIYRHIRTNSRMPVSIPLVVGLILWYGLLAVFVVIGGNVGALKRIISIPGILGVVLWVGLLASPIVLNTPAWIASHKSEIAIITLVILLISAPLALGRSITDGQGNPYDTYLTENERGEMNWIMEYTTEGNQPLTTYQFKDHFGALQTIYRPLCTRQPESFDSVVYHSGKKGRIIFDQRASPSNFDSRVDCRDYNW